jgi:Transcriptional regulator/sugar kinase
MDIGGTEIKAQTYVDFKPFSENIRVFTAKSEQSKSEIFGNFAEIILSLFEEVPEDERRLDGVGMAFPGPFDYQNGISRIRGLGKYDSIYGCDIRKELKNYLPYLKAADIPFVFLHDIEAFAIGQTRFGEAENSARAMFVCIGTGAGSAFTQNGRILRQAAEGVPENGWIYNTVYRDGVIDDYLSVRGLARISARYFADATDGKALQALSEQGNLSAIAVFSEFGKDVCGALAPFLQSFRPDILVLGGQISKSFGGFGRGIEELCDQLGTKIAVSFHTSDSILKGLLSAFAENSLSGQSFEGDF